MSGYYLYQSTRLESFLETYPEIFRQDDPLSEPVFTVVQNAGLGEWLTRFMAGRQGSVLGARILMPEQALRRFAEGFPTARRLLGHEDKRGKAKGLLFMDEMKAAVFKGLEEAISGTDPVYDPLRRYVEGAGGRMWQLSDAVAGIFYHYGMNCLPLVASWDSGRPFAGLRSEDRSSEEWQRALWCRIFNPDAPYTHLSRVLAETMTADDSYDGPRGRIVLFGSMFLGETGIRFFRHIAKTLDVHHFLLSPSRALSESVGNRAVSTPKRADSDTSETIFKPGELDFGERDASRESTPVGNTDVDQLLPILRENGRLSAGFASLLPQLEPTKVTAFFKEPDQNSSAESSTTLDLLQRSLEENSPFTGPVSDDGSLKIHNISGPRREVEVLKDRILAALREDPELAPTEIGVLAPDIGKYAPYIEAVFPSANPERYSRKDDLPFNLTDLPVRSVSPYPAGVAALLALPGSRFGRRTLLELFGNPCFAPLASEPDDLETWRRFIEELHVRWGADADHRRGKGAADPSTGSWETAFKRLLAGYYHDEGDDPDLLPASLGGDSEARVAGDMIRAIRDLKRDFLSLDGETRALREWILHWEVLAERWLKPRPDSEDDEHDRLRIKGAFRDLTALCDNLADLSDFENDRIPWTAFSSLLEEAVSPSNGRRGRYLARGITCSSLKPMRAIVFKRIYVLGMDEGAWPGREYLTGFDLRDQIPKAIDLSRESVDRFAFLETILSAREHLAFFYSGRDPERGETQAPAAPLVELCEHLGKGWEHLVLRHPLVPYDPTLFTGVGPLSSSSQEALALADVRHRSEAAPLLEERPLPPAEETEAVDWTDLAAFLTRPLKKFYAGRLGASGGSAAAELDEEDVLEATFLDWWQWRRDAVVEDPAVLEDPKVFVDAFRKRLELEGGVARTPTGVLKKADWEAEAASLSEQLLRLRGEGLELSEPFSCILDPQAGLDGSAASPEPGALLRLPAPLLSPPGKYPLRISGRIPGLRPIEDTDGRLVWTMVSFVSSNQVRSAQNLAGWTAALVLGAAFGWEELSELRVFRIGAHDLSARRYYFNEAAMKHGEGGDRRLLEPRFLTELAGLYRDGESTPLCFYPELADKLAKKDAKTPLEDRLAEEASAAWDDIIGNRFASHSVLRDSPYRQRFLKEPEFSSPAFRRAWNLYKEGGIL